MWLEHAAVLPEGYGTQTTLLQFKKIFLDVCPKPVWANQRVSHRKKRSALLCALHSGMMPLDYSAALFGLSLIAGYERIEFTSSFLILFMSMYVLQVKFSAAFVLIVPPYVVYN